MYSIDNNQNNNINFKRRLKPSEVKPYTQSISEGLKILDKELDIILHNSCAPSKASQNTGVGSLLSETTEKQVLPFLNKHSVSSIQQDPDGLRKGLEGSPYVGDDSAKNVLMIPLEKLKRPECGALIKQETFNSIVNNRPNKQSNLVDYSYVIPKYNEALHEAYGTFKEKSFSINSLSKKEAIAIKQLNAEFLDFKKEKGNKLEKTAIYNILSDKHGDVYWPNWKDSVDRTLYQPAADIKKAANNRLKELKIKNADKIDEFLFSQMLLSKSRSETATKNAKYGIKTIADSPVAFSVVDTWAHQDIFMKDWHLGCPPDSFSKKGQAWGFSVIDPKTIFKKDGSIGKGGKLLFDKYESMFRENKGGVRIDHIIGLIDPFVYKTAPTAKSAGRLYSAPNNPELKPYAKHTTEEYAGIIEKIVIPAAQKAGLDSKSIICEDLGSELQTVKNVMKELNLRGMAVTQLSNGSKKCPYRGKNVPQNNIIMIGSHDFSSLIENTNQMFTKPKHKSLDIISKGLAEDTTPQGTNIKEAKAQLMSNKEKFRTAKFIELFTSPAKTVQVFFTDFFGISKTYNVPGTDKGNWALRLPSKFENSYHKNLEKNRGLNLPETLAAAIRHKGNDFAEKHESLLQRLDNFANILKEKEQK